MAIFENNEILRKEAMLEEAYRHLQRLTGRSVVLNLSNGAHISGDTMESIYRRRSDEIAPQQVVLIDTKAEEIHHVISADVVSITYRGGRIIVKDRAEAVVHEIVDRLVTVYNARSKDARHDRIDKIIDAAKERFDADLKDFGTTAQLPQHAAKIAIARFDEIRSSMEDAFRSEALSLYTKDFEEWETRTLIHFDLASQEVELRFIG